MAGKNFLEKQQKAKEARKAAKVEEANELEQRKSSSGNTAAPASGGEEVGILPKLGMCLFYMMSSSCLTLVNKQCYEKFKFKSPLNLFLVQCICNITICMLLMGRMTMDPKAFSFASKFGLKFTTYGETFSKLGTGIKIGMICLITVIFGLFSVKNVNVPMFLTMRRCCIFAVLIMNYLIQGTVPKPTEIACTGLLLTGAVVAGYETLDSAWFGYALVWGNNFTQAIQNVTVAKFNADKRISAFEINFYFACVGLPICLILLTNSGEIMELFDVFINPETANTGLQSYIIISGCFGILITISATLTTAVCGPLALNIAGTLKDVGLTYAGFILFDDVKVTTNVLIGLTFSFVGASYLVYFKYEQSQKTKKA